MAQIFPSLETIRQFKVQPTEGEWTFLRFLDKVLDDNFEVYFNPFLNGDRPDIIILKKQGGVLIIEVKDWDLDLYKLDEDKNWRLAHPKNEMEKYAQILSPIKQCIKYKENLYNLYSKELFEKKLFNQKFWALATCCVYFHKASHKKIENFLVNPFLSEEDYQEDLSYIELIGRDDLDEKKFKIILEKNYMLEKKSYLFDDELYESIHRILQPPMHLKDQGKFIRRFDASFEPKSSDILMFSKKQDELIFDKKKRQQWRVKGVVGSGKTTLLAAKAIQVYKELIQSGVKQPKILILTFNITLRNFIHDKLQKINETFDWKSFTISNYHSFLKTQLTNLEIVYDNDGSEEDLSSDICDNYELFSRYKDRTERFDVIFVDEIQDYKREWMNIIKDFFLIEGKNYPFGGYYLLGDVKQNIYTREISKKDVATNILGVHTLDSCFRSQTKIKDLALRFQEKFFDKKYDIDSALFAEEDYLFKGQNQKQGVIDYINLQSDDLLKSTFEVINNIIEHRLVKVALNDIAVLGVKIDFLQDFDCFYSHETHRKTTTMFETYEEMFLLGLQGSCFPYINYLNKDLNYPIKYKNPDSYKPIADLFITYYIYNLYPDLFEKHLTLKCLQYGYGFDEFLSIMNKYNKNFCLFLEEVTHRNYKEIRRHLKFNFWMNTGNIKISSVHSFKGWESDTVFLIVPSEKTSESFDELIYTGITRARTNLFIINLNNKKYHEKLKTLVDACK
jgi:hypothetical protein